MGSKNITRLLNVMVGSSHELGRSSSFHNLRKLKTELKSNSLKNYHISSPKFEEIQNAETIKSIKKKKSQQELFSETSGDKKGILNDIGKPDIIKGASSTNVDPSKQKIIEKIEPPPKTENELKTSVQLDASENIEKSKAMKSDKSKGTEKTLKSKLGRGMKIDMIDLRKKEMKGSYASMRKKQMETNSLDNMLFRPKRFFEDREKSNITQETNVWPLNIKDNSLKPSIAKEVESSQTKETNIQKQEKTSIKAKVVESESINKEKLNMRVNEIEENLLKGNEVVGGKQMNKTEGNNLEKENNTTKESKMLEKESAEISPKTSKNYSKSSQNLLKSQETKKIAFESSESNQISSMNNKNINSPFNMIRNSKITEENWSSVKQDQPRTVEVDSTFPKKYMFNTLLDPIAKSSRKQAQNRRVSSQSGESSKVNDPGKVTAQKVDDKIPDQTKSSTDKLTNSRVIPAVLADLLKEDAEQKTNMNTVQRSYGLSIQQIEQQIIEQQKIIDLNNSAIEKLEASINLLKDNSKQELEKKIAPESDGTSNQQVEHKIPKLPSFNRFNILGLGKAKIGAATDYKTVQKSDRIYNQEVNQIPAQPKIVNKLNNSGIEREKSALSTDSNRSDGTSNQKIEHKIAEQPTFFDKLNNWGRGKQKLTDLNTSDKISNQEVNQISEQPKIVDELNNSGIENKKSGLSTDSNTSDGISNQNIEHKITEQPKIVDRMNNSAIESEKSALSTDSNRSDGTSNQKIEHKITEQPTFLNKLNNWGRGKQKLTDLNTSDKISNQEVNQISEQPKIVDELNNSGIENKKSGLSTDSNTSVRISKQNIEHKITEQPKIVDRMNNSAIESEKSGLSTYSNRSDGTSNQKIEHKITEQPKIVDRINNSAIESEKSGLSTYSNRSDGTSNQKIKHKITEQPKIVDKINNSAIESERSGLSTYSNKSDGTSNQKIDQKIPERPKIVDKFHDLGRGKAKSALSTDLNRSDNISNQKIDQKIPEQPKVVDKFHNLGIGKAKSALSTDLNRSDNISNQNIDIKIPEQPKVVDKFHNLGMGKEKSEASTNSKKEKVEQKSKPTLKVKYRIKETLKDKLQKLNKSESLKIVTTDKNNEKEFQRFAVTARQEVYPKLDGQITSIEKHQSIDKPLQQKGIVIRDDFNERGIAAFDSSYIISQLAKSRQSLSFEDIPGPKLMRVCSNIVNALPVIGTQTISSLMRSYNRLCLSYGDKKLVSSKIKPLESLFNSYGDIVCINIPLCGDVILVDKPELIHEIYRQRDLSQMTNSTFDSLNEVYNVLDNKRIRVNPSIDEQMTCVIEHFDLKNLFWSANRYHDSLEKMSDMLVERVATIRDMHNEVPKDFIKELKKWSLECTMQVLFATEIGSLRSGNHFGTFETERTLKSITDATDALINCETGIQLWRVYETSSFTKLTKSIQNLEKFLCKHIPLLKHDTKLEHRLEILQSNLESKQNASSLISGLILSGYVDVDKLLKICMETMLIAVNTTSTSLGFILYHLARNQEKQKTLHKELMSALPDKSSKLNPDVLQELPYLNACVQETLRLKHPIPFSFLRLQRGIVLHKYHIPAGTWVMTANEVACLREENFPDAELFKPERWLESSADLYQDTISPLLEAQFEPFLGRDWLQKQLLIGTAKIIRNFNVKYRYGEIGKEGEFLSKPTKPFQFEFVEQHV